MCRNLEVICQSQCSTTLRSPDARLCSAVQPFITVGYEKSRAGTSNAGRIVIQRHSNAIPQELGELELSGVALEWRCLGLADWNWNWTAIPFHVGIGMAWRGEIFEFEGLEWRGVTPEKRFGIGTGLDNPRSNAVGVAWRGPLTQVKNWSRIAPIQSNSRSVSVA